MSIVKRQGVSVFLYVRFTIPGILSGRGHPRTLLPSWQQTEA